MYSWERIAVRTERVYDAAAASRRDDSMLARLTRFYKCERIHMALHTGSYLYIECFASGARSLITLCKQR